MSAQTNGRRFRIAVGYDGSTLAARAVRWAADEARRTGGVLTVVSAWDPTVVSPWQGPHRSALRDGAEMRAAAGVSLARTVLPEGANVESKVAEGSAGHVLTSESAHQDLLVLGTHGRLGPVAAALGSTSRACTRHASCPVVLIGLAGADEAPARLVVACAQGGTHNQVLTWAAERAGHEGLPVHLVGAWRPGPASPWELARDVRRAAERQAQTRYDDTLHRLSALAGAGQPSGELVEGRLHEVVAATTRAGDLLITGRSPERDLAALVDHAWCPVVVVPTPTPLPRHQRGAQATVSS